MLRTILIALTIFITGCAASGMGQFYEPHVDISTLPADEIVREEGEPQVVRSDDLNRDARALEARGYIVLGASSSFNGVHVSTENIQAQAKKIGSTLILIHFGTANANSTYGGYPQAAVYLVKQNRKGKFGLLLQNLPPEARLRYERNTGAFVQLVLEDTPAFFAYVLPGDIIISVDDILVRNAIHARELMENVPPSATSSQLRILRNGLEQTIEVNFY